MSLTENEYKEMIVSQVGDTDDSIILSNIDLLWQMGANGVNTMYLQFLQAKIEAILLLMGTLRESVNFQQLDVLRVDMKQRIENLQVMLNATTTMLNRAKSQESSQVVSSGPVVVQLRTTAPRSNPNPFGNDGNAPKYRGDLYE